MVIAVAGWVLRQAARGQLFHQVNGLFGGCGRPASQSIVENAMRGGGTGLAAIISFVLLAVSSRRHFASLDTALNLVWPLSRRADDVFALVRVRLISFGLVLGVAFLLIVSLVLDTAIQAVGKWLWGDSSFVIISGRRLAVSCILSLAFGALLKFLPDGRVDQRVRAGRRVGRGNLCLFGKKLFAFLTVAGAANWFGAAGRSPFVDVAVLLRRRAVAWRRVGAGTFTIHAARGAS